MVLDSTVWCMIPPWLWHRVTGLCWFRSPFLFHSVEYESFVEPRFFVRPFAMEVVQHPGGGDVDVDLVPEARNPRPEIRNPEPKIRSLTPFSVATPPIHRWSKPGTFKPGTRNPFAMEGVQHPGGDGVDVDLVLHPTTRSLIPVSQFGPRFHSLVHDSTVALA